VNCASRKLEKHTYNKLFLRQEWYLASAIPAFARLRYKDLELKSNLDYKVRWSQKKKNILK
jgi:hypothetical protein